MKYPFALMLAATITFGLLVFGVSPVVGEANMTEDSGDINNYLDFDPFSYFPGLWSGIDPLDGAEIVRSIVPTPGESNNFTFVGRIEYAMLCAAPLTSDNGGGGGAGDGPPPTETVSKKQQQLPEGPPEISSQLIPGRLNGFGFVREEDGVFQISGSLTCAGELSPRFRGVPAFYEYVTDNIMVEKPSFRLDDPIYLHRIG